jgi:hypothetical protein
MFQWECFLQDYFSGPGRIHQILAGGELKLLLEKKLINCVSEIQVLKI